MLNRLTPQNWNVVVIGLLTFSGAGLLWASTYSSQSIKGLSPHQNEEGTWGYKIIIERRPIERAKTFLVTGFCCLGIGSYLAFKSKEDLPTSIPDTLTKTLEWMVDEISDTWEGAGEQAALVYSKTCNVVIRSTPPVIKTQLQKIAENYDWLNDFLKYPHHRVIGATGSGKTKLLGLIIHKWYEEFPDSKLFIADSDYGKPDENKKLNNWFGLSAQWIKTSDDEIDALIDYVWEQLNYRRNQCIDAVKSGAVNLDEVDVDLSPICLVCEEFDRLAKRYKNNKSSIIDKIVEIVKNGRAYKIKLIAVGQSASSGEGGFTLASMENLAQILLCYPAIPESQVRYLKGSVSDLISQAQGLIDQGHRPAICELKGRVQVVCIPDLSGFNLDFSEQGDTQDDNETWWATTLTPSFALRLENLAIKYTFGVIPSPLKSICAELGIEVRNADIRYSQYFKPYWESLLNEQEINLKR